MGDGKKLKEYLDEKVQMYAELQKKPALVPPRYTRLFKKIPISALTLHFVLPML